MDHVDNESTMDHVDTECPMKCTMDHVDNECTMDHVNTEHMDLPLTEPVNPFVMESIDLVTMYCEYDVITQLT